MPRVRVGRLFGIPIELDASWFVVVAVAAWYLATQVYPVGFPGHSATADAVSGLVTALALFASIVAHEMGHSLVARRLGIEVENVTLFLFGGVARLAEEPRSARSELLMALAGPLTSVVLCVVFRTLYEGAGIVGVGSVWSAPLLVLAAVNLSVALFNLAPGFPMDGGRVLRAFLWWSTGDRLLATRVARVCGRALGVAIAGLGIWAVISGDPSGAWYAILGSFLFVLAGVGRRGQDAWMRFAGTSVAQIMDPLPENGAADRRDARELIDARESLEVAARRFSETQTEVLLVVSGGRLIGRLGIERLGYAGRELHDASTVGSGWSSRWRRS